MHTFSTFRIFSNVDQAKELVDLLDENQVLYQVEDSSPDAVLAPSDSVQKEIRVKLRQEDFSRVDSMLEAIALSSLSQVSSDHYLFEFSDEELYEVLEKPDEWGKNDYVLAQKILRDRGKEITKEKLDGLQQARMKALSKPESGQMGWIVFGYISALGGGLIAIFIGWCLMTFKKTLPDGRKVYTYTSDIRKHGQFIFLLGIICFLFWMTYAIIHRTKLYRHL